MKITVSIKFKAGKQKIEGFGSNRYSVYLVSAKEEEGAMDEFILLMSKYLGVPPNRVTYKGKQGESFIFEVD